MLIEFNVENYRSIREKQQLSMVSTSSPDFREQNTFSPNEKAVPRLLRSLVMFGPNAGGKSTVIKALHFMRHFVVSSASGRQEGEEIDVTPFLLDEDSQQSPSEFETLFVQDGVRYQYGFSATRTRVISEWLLAYPTGKAQRWFERTYDSKKETYDWYIGPSFKGRAKVLTDATRSNALFLSTGVQLNNDQLKPVFHWFHKLAVIRSHGRLPKRFRDFTLKQCNSEASKKRVIEFLREADLGIDGLRLEKQLIDESLLDLPDNLSSDVRKKVDKLIGTEHVRPLFMHKMLNSEDKYLEFELEDESDGTQNLFSLAGPWLDVLENGMVVVFDELDTSLHPKIVRFLICLLHDNSTNPNNAQLVCTSHDVTLMEGDLFRRDQIWFVEKNSLRSTQLVPLSDFSPRKGEAIMKGYLKGRYGGLPYIPRLAC